MRLIDADTLKDRFGNTNMDIYTDEVKNEIDNAPTIEPKETENIGTDYNECDQFICRECGIHLQDWVRIDEDDYDDGIVHEYVFKYCPHCGAKIKHSGEVTEMVERGEQ